MAPFIKAIVVPSFNKSTNDRAIGQGFNGEKEYRAYLVVAAFGKKLEDRIIDIVLPSNACRLAKFRCDVTPARHDGIPTPARSSLDIRQQL